MQYYDKNFGLPPHLHKHEDGSMKGDKAENHRGDPAWDSDADKERVEVKETKIIFPVKPLVTPENNLPPKRIDAEVADKEKASAKKEVLKEVPAKK